ncbi:anti-sigma factor RsbA family regulatory protein [Nonomuraea sp. NPDC059023]|uniref:anti-sigma factor RsbA family regulatory protein n=1 Tax=unclassified Nonomuraea TaxID=2593643 RepID=UPI00368E5206
MHPARAQADHESLRHIGMPYDSDEGFLRLVLPRVRAALHEGRRVLAVTCSRKLQLLADALDRDAGRIDRRIAASWYAHPQRTLAAYHEYARDLPTLIVGEPSWQGRTEREIREWIRYESVLNAALGAAPAIVVCLYDLRTTPTAALDYRAVTHPFLAGLNGEAVSEAFVEPHDLILDGDRHPLPDPTGQVTSVGFTAHELKRFRQAVADYARAAGMERNLVSSLVLSVSEIAANCVEHGAGHGMIRMWVTGRELVCEIADPGGVLDDPLPGYIPPEPESPRGYGLWISRQLCDLVEMRDDAGTLRVRLHLGLGGPLGG